jgi:hypothetical protein
MAEGDYTEAIVAFVRDHEDCSSDEIIKGLAVARAQRQGVLEDLNRAMAAGMFGGHRDAGSLPEVDRDRDWDWRWEHIHLLPS